MRKTLTFALTVALATTFAMPLTSLLAQNQATVGTLAGRSVDAMGRGVFGERVELVRDTQVLGSVTTNGLGEWSFRSVEPGVYVVRMNVRGRVAGVRVTVAAGQAVAGTMIVVPAATASLQLGAFANLLTIVGPGAIATSVQVAAAVVQVVETTELSPELLVAVLSAMPEAERQAFAAAVVSAIQANPAAGGTFTQYVQQFQAIATAPPNTPVPNFPTPVPVNPNAS